MLIIHVVGARPNFMKVAPVMRALASAPHIKQVLVHTGQHYDQNMSEVFFRELNLREPDINLEVGSASHAVQTAKIMMRFERILTDNKVDLVLVYGDINSTVASTLVCSKLQIKVGHVEAGLRSFDRTMPEEINRLVTDQISDLLFTPSDDGNQNLAREGIDESKIFLVGNVMIDTVVNLLPKAEARWTEVSRRLGLSTFGLVTLHRPSNVDNPVVLKKILASIDRIAARVPIIFPIHPRTRKKVKEIGIALNRRNFRLIEPLGYLDFLALQQKAALVITDSGGIQEETTYLGIPCLTVRENTERPITVSLGTNTLIGQDMDLLEREADRIINGGIKEGKIPQYWDGRAGQRIADIVTSL